ncbi:hypothetical protein [Mesorhizobium koreense]|uniref:hypothetical protein n=1 Tax=Mesorhizobium koreense TaxID=3074855 RepID=UPI00287B7642|nr:hypothetical protein [Mesorhizobium sp. WR6]
MTKLRSATPRRIAFQYLVPVHVEAEDGLVCAVLGRANPEPAKAEAILAGVRDPDKPVAATWPCHVLAQLQEGRVRNQIDSIIESDPNFSGLAPDAVSDDDIHAACLSVAANIDLAEEIGAAKFRSALAALRSAKRGGGLDVQDLALLKVPPPDSPTEGPLQGLLVCDDDLRLNLLVKNPSRIAREQRRG